MAVNRFTGYLTKITFLDSYHYWQCSLKNDCNMNHDLISSTTMRLKHFQNHKNFHDPNLNAPNQSFLASVTWPNFETA